VSQPQSRPFGSVLVANRGEIAIRVLRAARSAGLRTIAVFSDADAGSAHVSEADNAVRIGPTPAAASYLSIPALLRACADSGAEAVHPGYGFLSEQAAFARAVTDAGLVWIGPPPDVIELMGRKDHARDLAVDAGVAVPASYEAGTPRFPVLVKPAAGGGGKGMRIVHDPAELPAALAAARREAIGAFGDDTLLLEQFVPAGRHVEVQVLADVHGAVLHLYERDCSVQRRHQKVLEESPAPTISASMRARLCDAAVALARRVGYVNAGTVEFLVAGEDYFFLEMNTRLQVEHAVTEQVTGLDLVGLQLAVAAGEPLPLTQHEVRVHGHAIEARIYAEDPYAGFLPRAGRVDLARWPTEPTRVDTALHTGDLVSTAYDPMLGKVTVHAADRPAALAALVAALDTTALCGVQTNAGFLRALVAGPEFTAAAVDTQWLDSDPAAQSYLQRPEPAEAVWAQAARAVVAAAVGDQNSHPFAAGDGWRLAGDPAPARVLLRSGGSARLVTAAPAPDPATVVHVTADAAYVVRHAAVYRFDRPDAGTASGQAGAAAGGDVLAPMPGTVLRVVVETGQRVQAGEPLGVLEAMKMELTLTAPADGVVTDVDAVVGQQVRIGHVLFAVRPEEE
jgi:acetyl-CoA/propionyl-CoA carboxylase, biotin carboxylase, biotin carboxyl carrier protein